MHECCNPKKTMKWDSGLNSSAMEGREMMGLLGIHSYQTVLNHSLIS